MVTILGRLDPIGDVFADLGGRLDPAWFLLALLVPGAIVVLWFGNRQLRGLRSAADLEPSGRPELADDEGVPAALARIVARLEGRPPAKAAEAAAGPVRLRGRIVAASETFGPPGGPACVYRNRAGAPPRAAVAAGALVIADETGKVGIEQLARARVEAPHEPVRRGRASLALYLGDEVEVVGTFQPERIEGDGPPTETVYGSLGGAGPVLVRVVHRAVRSSVGPAPTDTSQPSSTPS